jgi:hypothetical protein
MIIQSCLSCKFHQVKHEEKERISYCQKENLWSQLSKCVMKKALTRFLEQESSLLSADPKFSPPPARFCGKEEERG